MNTGRVEWIEMLGTAAGRALWCLGVALLAVGALLVSEGTALADPGDLTYCTSMCSMANQCNQENANNDGYGTCLTACMGQNASVIPTYCGFCALPVADCPRPLGGCVANQCRRNGLLGCCPTACRCLGKMSGSGCECAARLVAP